MGVIYESSVRDATNVHLAYNEDYGEYEVYYNGGAMRRCRYPDLFVVMLDYMARCHCLGLDDYVPKRHQGWGAWSLSGPDNEPKLRYITE